MPSGRPRPRRLAEGPRPPAGAAAAGARRWRSSRPSSVRSPKNAVTKVSLGRRLAQHRVGLREHLGRARAVPAARLDEEAGHGAQGGGLDALAGHVAHEQGNRPAGEPPGAVDVPAGGLAGRRLVEQAQLAARQLGQRVGHEAARERAGDAPLALEVDGVGDRRRGAAGQPRQQVGLVLPERPVAQRGSRRARRTGAGRARSARAARASTPSLRCGRRVRAAVRDQGGVGRG